MFFLLSILFSPFSQVFSPFFVTANDSFVSNSGFQAAAKKRLCHW